MLLIDTWTLTTGRTLRDVPPCQLTEEELIDFWADYLIAGPDSAREARRTGDPAPRGE